MLDIRQRNREKKFNFSSSSSHISNRMFSKRPSSSSFLYLRRKIMARIHDSRRSFWKRFWKKLIFIIVVFFVILLHRGISSGKTENFDELASPTIDFDPMFEEIPIVTTQLLSFEENRNSTHFWSWRLADKKHYRLTRLLPCRTVDYKHYNIVEPLNSCDYSSNNEFSVENTLKAQKWIFEHQNPSNCSGKRFAIITGYASSGYGSIIHQIVWAFAKALEDDRIAVYQTPGNWIYADCPLRNLDCVFLPMSNCSVPKRFVPKQMIRIRADFGHWYEPIRPAIFQNHSFNWYRSQLLFYLMRFKPETLMYVQNVVAGSFHPPSLDAHRPYIALYVRRSDKVQFREMSQAYTLRQYFDLFDTDVRKANIRNIYINSEDEKVFKEFEDLNKEMKNYYKLLSINVTRNIVYRKLLSYSHQRRAKIAREFLTDLYIEAHADVHVGTLTSNWCRLVDEIRLVLGKKIPFYTPENQYLMDM